MNGDSYDDGDHDEDEHMEDGSTAAAQDTSVYKTIDSAFFNASTTSGVSIKGKFASDGFTRSKMYPHQVGAVASAGEKVVVNVNVGGSGASAGGKGKGKIRSVELPVAAPGMGFGLEDAKSKKHKKTKRGKVRVNWTADERCD
jgi:hypothetical protein